MKKRVKKVVCALLTAAVAVSFAGCGKKETVNSNVKTITVWSANGHNKDYYMKKVEEFNTTVGKERGLAIDYQVIADMNKMVELGMQTGELPHMFDGSKLKTLVEKDLIIPITDLPGGEEFLKEHTSTKSEECVYDGKVYCFPLTTGPRALLYNREMFKAAGLVDANGEPTPPTSLEELREYAKKLTNPAKNEYGLIIPFKWRTCLQDWTGMAQSYNGFGNYNPKTGKYDFSGYIPILNTLMDIKKDGSILPGSEGIDNDPARARFGEGGIGMKFGYYWDYGVLTQQFPAKIDWGVAPYPIKGADGKNYMQACGDGYSSRINKSVLNDIGGEDFMFFYKWWFSDEFRAGLFAGGYDIPKDERIVEMVNFKDGEYKQWREFGELVKISAEPPIAMKSDTSGCLKVQEDFLKSVWNGNESVEDFCKRKEDEYNKGIEKYKQLNPDYDQSTAIDADWDISY